MNHPDVSKLTRGLARCDETAWRRFHDRYYQMIHSLATARGATPCEAPEIVQGVYLKVLRNAKPIPNERELTAWLACLVRSEVVDSARRKQRRGRMLERFVESQPVTPETESEDSYQPLHEAFSHLPEMEQTLLRRHYYEGWSQQRLAELTQTSVKAIESKLARLRKRLRRILENPSSNPT